jgi:hypothetical protein
MKQSRPLGVVLYDGPSRINGRPIVVIATFKTKNRKTGQLIQTWIMPANESPVDAARAGTDDSVCGTCPFRPIETDLCYVTLGQAPLGIWRAWKRGIYPTADFRTRGTRDLFADRRVRAGAWGDPVAAPLSMWQKLFRYSAGHVGYTHQWAAFPEFAPYLMASVHSPFEASCAADLGWRTFRTRNPDMPVLDNEVICPASDEGGHTRTCSTCMACNGNASRSNRRKSIVIEGHGSFMFSKRREAFHREAVAT